MLISVVSVHIDFVKKIYCEQQQFVNDNNYMSVTCDPWNNKQIGTSPRHSVWNHSPQGQSQPNISLPWSV